MAITSGSEGFYGAAASGSVTPNSFTHSVGQMLIARVIYKSSAIATCSASTATSGWAKVGEFHDGTTNSGNGTGSVAVAAFWKIATATTGEMPTIDFSQTVTEVIHVAVSYAKGGTDPSWLDPVGDGGPDTTADTSKSMTIQTHVNVKAGDMVDFFMGIRDDTVMTVPTITQTGVTFATVVERPDAATSDTGGADASMDGGHRLASSGTSSAAAVVTGTLSTSETGSAWMTRLRLGASGSFTADAFIKATQSATLTADAIIKKTMVSGSQWISNPQGSVSFYNVAYGNGYWVVGGDNGNIRYASSPAEAWTSNNQGSGEDFDAVTYANGYWVGTGDSGNLWYRATDPTGAWTENDQGTNVMGAVIYGNGYWVAVGTGAIIRYRATDPTGAWTDNVQGSQAWADVAYGGGYWVVVGNLGSLSYRATDPTGAFTNNSPTGQFLRGVVYGGGYFVAVGDDGAWFASDPTGSWAQAGDLTAAEAITYADGIWFAVASDGTVSRSTGDPDSWVFETDILGQPSHIFSNGQSVVAVGSSGNLSYLAIKFTLDAYIQGAGAGGSFTANAVILRTQTPALSANAVLKREQSATITADAVIKREQTASFTANAVVKATIAASFTADAVLKREQAVSFTADAVISAGGGTVETSFTANAVIKREQTASLTANAVIKREITTSLTADAVIARLVTLDNFDRTTSAGTLGLATDGWSQWTWMGVLNAGTDKAAPTGFVNGSVAEFPGTGSPALFERWVGHAVLTAGIIQFDVKTPADPLSKDNDTGIGAIRGSPGTSFIDVVGTDEAQLVLGDGNSYLTSFAPIPADTWFTVKFTVTNVSGLRKYGKIWLQGDPEPDWQFSSTSNATTNIRPNFALRSDEVLLIDNLRIWSGADLWSWLRTFPTDAVLLKTQAASFTSDAVIMPSFTADAVIAAGGGTVETSFTANAVILRTQTPALSANAVLRREQTATFTSNAVVQRIQAATLSADAVVKATISASFTADAIVLRTQTTSFPADAVFAIAGAGSLSADAVIRSQGAASFGADAAISRIGKPVWTTPGNNIAMDAEPVLTFVMPVAAGPMHFHIEIDKAATFDGPDFRSYKSNHSQINWEYWDGDSWEPIPTGGVSNSFSGNEARLTITDPLVSGVWYRRVRGGA